MKETILNFQKSGGFNGFMNILMIAQYISYGGPIIIKNKKEEKPTVVFFDHNGNECYWRFGAKFIDVDTAIIKLHELFHRETIESFTFFVEDLYCMFQTSEIGRKHYIKETYEDSELNMLRHHVTFTREELIKIIKTTESSTVTMFSVNDIAKLFNIDDLVLMESMDAVLKMLDKLY